jgi:hypothetical protein
LNLLKIKNTGSRIGSSDPWVRDPVRADVAKQSVKRARDAGDKATARGSDGQDFDRCVRAHEPLNRFSICDGHHLNQWLEIADRSGAWRWRRVRRSGELADALGSAFCN